MIDTAKAYRQTDDLDTSTCHCPCGSSHTWGGVGGTIVAWFAIHDAHVNAPTIHTITADGARCIANPDTWFAAPKESTP